MACSNVSHIIMLWFLQLLRTGNGRRYAGLLRNFRSVRLGACAVGEGEEGRTPFEAPDWPLHKRSSTSLGMLRHLLIGSLDFRVGIMKRLEL